eukprot:8293951-Heterocapsa_arctica.AAC.1
MGVGPPGAAWLHSWCKLVQKMPCGGGDPPGQRWAGWGASAWNEAVGHDDGQRGQLVRKCV